mmetsp:Transcript_9105/g.17674  ORF Transcript_9105/g.17674 Transcript_9105/m.17674 type:complete len:287 (-) Transcript_9105:327-1187(-)
MHTGREMEYECFPHAAAGQSAMGHSMSPPKRKVVVDEDDEMLDRLQRGVKRMRLSGAPACLSDEKDDLRGDSCMLYATTKGAQQYASGAGGVFTDRSNRPPETGVLAILDSMEDMKPSTAIFHSLRIPSSFSSMSSKPSSRITVEGADSKGRPFLLEVPFDPSTLAGVGFGGWCWTNGSKDEGSKVRRPFACRLKKNRKVDAAKHREVKEVGSTVAFAFNSLDQRYKLWDAFSSAVAENGSVYIFSATQSAKQAGDWCVGGSSNASWMGDTANCVASDCADRFMME